MLKYYTVTFTLPPNTRTPIMRPEDVSIRPFQAQDLPTVIALLRASMVSYDTHKEEDNAQLEAYVQESIRGDLADIPANYVAKGGNFWVATIPEQNARAVVGMVALEAKGDGQGELRRMAVNADYRRLGLGRQLITNLERWAKAQRFRTVFLVTSSVMTRAQAFYAASGYVETRRFLARPEPPVELVRFEKQL